MTTYHWFKAHIHDLIEEECLELLASHPVGRIVFTDDRGPIALPINYVLHGRDILVAASPGGAIATWTPGRHVAFEIDDVDPAQEAGWSVVVRGSAEEASQRDLPDDPDARPYPWAEGDRTFILRIPGERITGRRLIPA